METTPAPEVDFSAVSIPFSATDLLSGGASLLAPISGFIILALAFVIVPKIINLVKGALASRAKA